MTAPVRYLSRLELRNFRAFESAHVDFAPITILVGPNNSGKSSVLSAVRLLAQTLQSVDVEVPLLLGEFGTYRDIVYKNKSNRGIGITVGYTYRENQKASFVLNFKYRAQRREIILKDAAIYTENGQALIKTSYSIDSEKHVISEFSGSDDDQSSIIAKPVRLAHFLPRVNFLRFDLERKREATKPRSSQVRKLIEVDRRSREATWLLQSVQYLGPFRDTPLRLYPFSGERPSFLSPTGRGALDILVADYFRRGTRKRELSNKVRQWFVDARIARDLEITAVSDRHYEVKFQHSQTGEFENLADVGYGISQILPVVIAGHNLGDQSIFIVEQPEIHLHPRAQAELGTFFLQLYLKGVQCIVETHSEHLIMRIQRHVAEGLIPPSEVAVNYVGATERSKQITKMDLGHDGIFRTPWPGGFFEERLEEALQLARAPLEREGPIG